MTNFFAPPVEKNSVMEGEQKKDGREEDTTTRTLLALTFGPSVVPCTCDGNPEKKAMAIGAKPRKPSVRCSGEVTTKIKSYQHNVPAYYHTIVSYFMLSICKSIAPGISMPKTLP